MLEGAYQLSWRELETGLKRALDEYERELFRQAEKAPTNDAQNRLFEALKVFRKSNSQVLIGMRDDLQRGMLQLLVNPQNSPQSGAVDARDKLALVDHGVLELELAQSEIAARNEMRCSQQLSYVAVRFAVITGGAPVAIDALPIGPLRARCANTRT